MPRTRDRFPGEDSDELLERDPDEGDTNYSLTLDAAGRVQRETWTDAATGNELKRVAYTFDASDQLQQEVSTVFDPDNGVVVLSQKTVTYARSPDGAVTGASMVRNV